MHISVLGNFCSVCHSLIFASAEWSADWNRIRVWLQLLRNLVDIRKWQTSRAMNMAERGGKFIFLMVSCRGDFNT